jgi:hypothetical protein
MGKRDRGSGAGEGGSEAAGNLSCFSFLFLFRQWLCPGVVLVLSIELVLRFESDYE